jgi:hypothetical protein
LQRQRGLTAPANNAGHRKVAPLDESVEHESQLILKASVANALIAERAVLMAPTVVWRWSPELAGAAT